MLTAMLSPGGNPAGPIRVIGRATTARPAGKHDPRQHVALPDPGQGPRHLLLARDPADGQPSRWARPTQPGMQFDLYAWTGDYNSFAAAVRGAEAAISGAFQVGGTAYDDTMTIPQTAFLYMPSIVLDPTILGDANLDGKVDVNDLTIVLSNSARPRT